MTVHKIVITGPARVDPGGVSNYYNALLPHLLRNKDFLIQYQEIGSTHGSMGILHPLVDQLRVRRYIARERPALVHLNPSLTFKSFFRDGLFALQARTMGVPVIVFFRGWEEHVASRIDRELQWFFRATFGRANAFVVLAKNIGDRLRQWGVRAPISLENTVVPDAAVEGFSIEQKLGAMRVSKELKVLFMARLEPAKGLMETVEAVRGLGQAGVSIALTIAGDGAAMEDVRRVVNADEHARRHIQIVGYVRGDTKKALLYQQHVYCLPSYGEGMPNSLLEAMALGMPALTCAVGGIGDFFESGKMGYLVEPRDVAGLRERLKQLTEDRELLLEMAQYNHCYAMKHFLASDAAARLGKLYSSILTATS